MFILTNLFRNFIALVGNHQFAENIQNGIEKQGFSIEKSYLIFHSSSNFAKQII